MIWATVICLGDLVQAIATYNRSGPRFRVANGCCILEQEWTIHSWCYHYRHWCSHAVAWRAEIAEIPTTVSMLAVNRHNILSKCMIEPDNVADWRAVWAERDTSFWIWLSICIFPSHVDQLDTVLLILENFWSCLPCRHKCTPGSDISMSTSCF